MKVHLSVCSEKYMEGMSNFLFRNHPLGFRHRPSGASSWSDRIRSQRGAPRCAQRPGSVSRVPVARRPQGAGLRRGCGRSGCARERARESLGEGCLVAQGCRVSTSRSPSHRCCQVYQHWPEVTRHPVPVLWDSAGAWQAERVRGGAEGCLGGWLWEGPCGEHVWLGEREFRQSLPSLAVSRAGP